MFTKLAVFAIFASFGLVHCVPVAKGISASVMANLLDDFQKSQQNPGGAESFVVDDDLEQRFHDPKFVEYLKTFVQNFQKMFELLQTMKDAGEDTKSVQAALTERFGSPAFINFLTNLLQQFGFGTTSSVHTNSNTVSTSEEHTSEQHSSENHINTVTNESEVSNTIGVNQNDVLNSDTGFDSSIAENHASSSNINAASEQASQSNIVSKSYGYGYGSALNHQESAAELRRQNLNAHYKFSSYVNDNIRGELQSRKEVRDGAKVTGVYSYDDGFYSRTTWYKADEGGFVILKQEVKPSEKRGHLDGTADVKTYYDGNSMQYHITSKDIHPAVVFATAHV